MVRPAHSLRIVDLLSLRPGQILQLHRVDDRPILVPAAQRSGDVQEALPRGICSGADTMGHVSERLVDLFLGVCVGRSNPLPTNLPGILDCAVETHIVMRGQGGKIVQIFSLDPCSWRNLLKQEGAEVELRISGRIFARGVVTGGAEPGIRISALAEHRP